MAQDSALVLNRLFGLLNRWRHFATYQFERRVDIFFALYLREIVESRVKDPLFDTMIPEFPLWLDKLKLADYMLFSQDKKTVYLLEL
jgi:hypothetical protein